MTRTARSGRAQSLSGAATPALKGEPSKPVMLRDLKVRPIVDEK
jgi:hypothetical protein